AAALVLRPGRAAERRTPVVRRRSVRFAISEVVEVSMRIVRRAERRLKPWVLVGGVVGDEVYQHLEPHLVGACDKLVEVGERTVFRVDVVVVGDVVALVFLR